MAAETRKIDTLKNLVKMHCMQLVQQLFLQTSQFRDSAWLRQVIHNMKLIALVCTFISFVTVTSHAADYRLPFDGQWFVMAGGDTINVNHHMAERSQWFGVDFMKTGGPANRSVSSGSGKLLTDYYSWGQPVLSPVNGIVRKVHDGEADNPIGTTDIKNAFGNFVMIEAGPKEFVYLAHFQKGSVEVKEGAKIKAGDVLGKCGNSGNTSAPHIHMHVQDQPKPYAGNGQNITFHGIVVTLSGKKFDNVDWPLIQGLFVSQGKGE